MTTTIKALRDALTEIQHFTDSPVIHAIAKRVLALTADASEDAPAGENILARTAKLEDFHQSDPHDYAQFLAYVLWRDHYQEASPDFTIQAHKWGVMSQIDNMLTGLTRKVAANAARPAPVAAAPVRTVSVESIIAHEFLKWNRSLEKPLVEVTKELFVARKLLELAAAAAPAAPIVEVTADPRLQDLRMLVERLARKLEKECPGTDLVPQALDYLRRKGLQGSPLRAEPSPSKSAEHANPEPVNVSAMSVQPLCNSVPVAHAKLAEGATKRQQFEADIPDRLDFTIVRDAWDRPIYKHSHIEAMFYGWQARGQQAGAVDGEAHADNS